MIQATGHCMRFECAACNASITHAILAKSQKEKEAVVTKLYMNFYRDNAEECWHLAKEIRAIAGATGIRRKNRETSSVVVDVFNRFGSTPRVQAGFLADLIHSSPSSRQMMFTDRECKTCPLVHVVEEDSLNLDCLNGDCVGCSGKVAQLFKRVTSSNVPDVCCELRMRLGAVNKFMGLFKNVIAPLSRAADQGIKNETHETVFANVMLRGNLFRTREGVFLEAFFLLDAERRRSMAGKLVRVSTALPDSNHRYVPVCMSI